jgi:hypothetical protein
MKILFFVKCAVLGIIVISALDANEDQDAVENVIRRTYTSVARIENGKVFFKPEKICFTKGKIYVEGIDGVGVDIPVVFSSLSGLYMQVDESVIFNTWKCECDAWNHNWDNPVYCWHCGRSR